MKPKKILAAVLAMALMASLTACGESTPMDKVTKALSRVDKAKSYHGVNTMSVSVSAEGVMNSEIDLTTSVDFVRSPKIMAHAQGSQTQGGEDGSTTTLDSYLEENGKKFDKYTSTSSMPFEAGEVDSADSYDLLAQMAVYKDADFLKNGEATLDGEEEIEGRMADRILITVKNADLLNYMEMLGMYSMLEQMTAGMPYQPMIESIGDVPFMVWVDQENGNLLKIHADFTEAYNICMGTLYNGVCQRMIMEYTFSNYDNVTVEIPQDVKDQAGASLLTK
jgi:hypothetical protein